MSSQRGNVKKVGAPKHKNKTAFRNNLHDKSNKIKIINSLDTAGCCLRCKDIIEWKIKYKKYKPLTVPRTCIRCEERNIKRAYYIVCDGCARKEHLCTKCGKKSEIVQRPGLSPEEELTLQTQFQQELKLLPERKRRALIRFKASGKTATSGHTDDSDLDGAAAQASSDPEDLDVSDEESSTDSAGELGVETERLEDIAGTSAEKGGQKSSAADT